MRPSAILLLTTLSALSASCQIKENHVWAPTARVSAVVAESYDAQISGPGYSLGGDTEYRAVEEPNQVCTPVLWVLVVVVDIHAVTGGAVSK